MANFIQLKEQTKGLPLFHLNVDLWTSKANGQKFLGVRVYYVDERFNYSSKLLVVKVFNPSSVVRDSGRLSDILL